MPFFLFAQTAEQQAARDAGIPAPYPVAKRDTVMRWNEDSLIAARTASSDTVMRKKKSGTIAMLASMVLPGAGQIYNESYWKAPVVWGFTAYFYSVYRDQNTQYKHFRDAYAATVDSTAVKDQTALKDDLLSKRRFYFAQRNTFGWYLAITYLVTIIDAYVDASLFNFEVSPDLQPHGEWKATLHVRLR
jgi:hypothetical protein